MMNPYSHQPGISFLIPGTVYEAQVFPMLVVFYDLSSLERKKIKEIPLDVQGPLENFTVMQDLQRGCLSVWWEKGRYHILPTLELIFEKKADLCLWQKEELFLGSYKKKEWESVKKRLDFREILPIWHRLGTTLDLPERSSKKGLFSLLEETKNVISEKRPEKTLFFFKKMFLACFRGGLVPRLYDDEHQGIAKEEGGEISPLYFLTLGAKLIKSLFFSFDGNKAHLLPHLPPQLFAGSFNHIEFEWGKLDMRWSKKRVRQMVFYSDISGPIHFQFDSSLVCFRLRQSVKEIGKIHEVKKAFEVEKGRLYLLDRFEK